jgi:monoterpene epsilon-lactone hydrolase
MNEKTKVLAGAVASILLSAYAVAAEQRQAGPVYTAEGVVQVPAFELPPSPYMSEEAVELLKTRAAPRGAPPAMQGTSIDAVRGGMEMHLKPVVQAMLARYPVDIKDEKIAGVNTRVLTPKAGAIDDKRLLINVHGGAFSMCADACALLESAPIAAVGQFKVVSVNYRQGPEHTFPAASEDVAAVYKEMLKSYKPEQIGIYGCSAGGMLSGQVAAWLPAHNLPQAGAIGIFGAGAGRMEAGDSVQVSARIDGSMPPPPPPGTKLPPPPFRSYFDGADMNDPLVSPMMHLDVLAKFPPTLVITGTRAMDLSPAVYTHSQLVKADVPGDLIVGEGMSHCYMYFAQLPEARDAYGAIVNFFRKHLD